VVAAIDSFDRAVEFAAQPLRQALAENLGDFTAGHAPDAHIAGTFEDFADRRIAHEDKIATIFHLGKGVKATQINRAPLSF
jgi:hypothetical protein